MLTCSYADDVGFIELLDILAGLSVNTQSSVSKLCELCPMQHTIRFLTRAELKWCVPRTTALKILCFTDE